MLFGLSNKKKFWSPLSKEEVEVKIKEEEDVPEKIEKLAWLLSQGVYLSYPKDSFFAVCSIDDFPLELYSYEEVEAARSLLYIAETRPKWEKELQEILSLREREKLLEAYEKHHSKLKREMVKVK